MNELIAESWPDYQLIDSGDGLRLEQFSKYYIVRPDPNVIWSKSQPTNPSWENPDLLFNGEDRDRWKGDRDLLTGWDLSYKDATFLVQPTPFRHLGLFPEQSIQWDWATDLIKKSPQKPRVLNLFAYTGGASVMAALAGAEVCHVDASKASVFKAKDNALRSGLQEDAIRWIVDDVQKFLRREVRRGNTYDIIIMDPPVFGRGPKGEIWRLEEDVKELISLTKTLFSEKPLGFLLNFYATSLYPQSVLRLVEQEELPFSVELGALCLQEKSSNKLLQTGFFIRS